MHACMLVCVRVIWCDWTEFENSSKTYLGFMKYVTVSILRYQSAIRFAQLQNEFNCFHSMYVIIHNMFFPSYVCCIHCTLYYTILHMIIVMQKTKMSKLIAIDFMVYSIISLFTTNQWKKLERHLTSNNNNNNDDDEWIVHKKFSQNCDFTHKICIFFSLSVDNV